MAPHKSRKEISEIETQRLPLEDILNVMKIARGSEKSVYSILNMKKQEVSGLLTPFERGLFDNIFDVLKQKAYSGTDCDKADEGDHFPVYFSPVDLYCHMLDIEITKKKKGGEIHSINDWLWMKKYGKTFCNEFGLSEEVATSEEKSSEVVPRYLSSESGFRIIHPDELARREDTEPDGSIDGGDTEKQFTELARDDVPKHHGSRKDSKHGRKDPHETVYDDKKYHPRY